MQVNRPGFVSWLIFDLDHTNSAIWDDVGLPAPNMIVSNRTTGRSHLYYAIPPVCTTVAARSKPISYMKAVYAAIAVQLKADTDFHSGPVAKTPGHPWWSTQELHNHVYELGQLADYVDLAEENPWRSKEALEVASHSRHCLMFEFLRHYAYSIVNKEREAGSFERFTRLIEAHAYNKNSFHKLGFSSNLPQSSLRATVKSVARWTWDRYTGRGKGCHRGVMRLDADLPLQERQRLAAERTHSARRKETESKLRKAIAIIRGRGERMSQAAISRLTCLTRQTVAAYKHLMLEVHQVVKLVRPPPKKDPVKYAAHQVTPGLDCNSNDHGSDPKSQPLTVFDG